MPIKNMLISAFVLTAFAIVGTAMVSLTHLGTAQTIAENERQALLDNLLQLLPPEQFDNDIYTDTIEVNDPSLSGSQEPTMVYRARKGGSPVAAIFTSIAPDGYSGNIKLLVGIYRDGKLAGVRVVSHKETPGLGDRVDRARSDWVEHFKGRSLGDPAAEQWKVKKDGGVFDQFSGATITPRAVVKAVYNTLRYYEQHQDAVFGTTPPSASTEEMSHE